MRAKKTLLTAVSVCMGVTVLAGCGDDSGKGADSAFDGKSADAIAADAVKATRDAQSVRVRGNVQQPGGNEIRVDFHVDEQDRCTGTMSGQGAKADVIQVGQAAFVRGDEKFWQNALKGQPGAEKAIPRVQGKWVKSQPGQAGIEGMCDKQAFLAAMDRDKSERKGMAKGATSEVDGKKALALEKKQPGGERLTLYVAAEGKPYILKSVTAGGKQPGEVTLTDYGKKVEAKAPPADQIVDPKISKT
ncbi:hypothetical protein P8A22_26930 [Streptomyces laculatispora]|uniref:Lipoprotein n=1 Tax=Streptomyces laculatispora TaxID=887464 RepID=A0ABY9IAC7_9ACTN|nr:hypothetical protein [Streptomyces laculatispora]WLQ43229.1 hypothetical protein P8A22_26930 [Streptomyces laculatispora]